MTDSREVKVLQVFENALKEIFPGAQHSITSETVIADLGVDSISLMEIVGILEDELKVKLSDEEITKIRTVADLERSVNRKRAMAQLPNRLQ